MSTVYIVGVSFCEILFLESLTCEMLAPCVVV